MKKEIVTMLLAAALMTSSLTACTEVEVAGNDIDDTTITESKTPEVSNENINNELNTQEIPSTEDFINTIVCNGVCYNSPIRYTINSSGNLILYIPEWNEFFVIPKSEDMYFVAETVESSSAILSESECTLFFRDFTPDDKHISLIQFTRENPEVAIRPLNLPERNYSYGYKYCNFIDEKNGYLFLLDGPNDIQLRHLFKTTDGGETWVEQPVEASPSIYWKEDIICAKMLNENVGIIAAGYHANDDFSTKTYVTADGGKTWNTVGSSMELPCIEAYDFVYENGQYTILLKKAQYVGGEKYPYHLVSTDLINWTFVEE